MESNDEPTPMKLYYESHGGQHYVVLEVHRDVREIYQSDEQRLRGFLSEHLELIRPDRFEKELYYRPRWYNRKILKPGLVPRSNVFLREAKIHYHAYRSEDPTLVEKILADCKTETGIQPQQGIESAVKEAFQLNSSSV